MVYPKNLALPRKQKKAKLSTSSTNDADPTPSNQADMFSVICEIMGVYNTMIAANTATLRKLEDESARNKVLQDERFDALLHRVEALEERVGGIAQSMENANTKYSAKLGWVALSLAKTSDILKSRLDYTERRVFGIQHRIAQADERRRKRKREEGK